MDRRRLEAFSSIPERAHLVLYLIFCLFALLIFRIWHLSISKHEHYITEAFRSRQITIREPSMRGTIRDRFNIVLAANVIEYRIGIMWTAIQEVPRFTTTLNNGKKTRISLRKEYIHALSSMIAKELSLDAARIEDMIHSYAVFSSSVPLFLKSGLTEVEYYRMNMLAKDWPGLVVEKTPRRIYPQEKQSCHIIGYTSPVNQEEYERVLSEKKVLGEYLHRIERGEDAPIPMNYTSFFEVRERLLSLERKAYTLTDETGKAGIEASFEGSLRGLSGKKCFATNAQGEIIRKRVGSRPSISGKRLILSLSSELQEHAEKLLAQDEISRKALFTKDNSPFPLTFGGAIVALDPNTYEVLACASFPRFNPNDFVRSQKSYFDKKSSSKAVKWVGGDLFFQKTWDMQWPLIEKEEEFSETEEWLDWKTFLSQILPKDSFFHDLFSPSTQLSAIAEIQLAWYTLANALYPNTDNFNIIEQFDSLTENSFSSPEEKKAFRVIKKCFSHLSSTQEKALLFDLSRLIICVDKEKSFFQQKEMFRYVCSKLPTISISAFRKAISTKVFVSEEIKKEALLSFTTNGPFTTWRKEHEKEFLKEKREEEKTKKLPAKPFLHYIDKECNRQFQKWWKEEGDFCIYAYCSGNLHLLPEWLQDKYPPNNLNLGSWDFASLSKEEGIKFLSLCKGFDDLDYPLLGRYGSKSIVSLQDLIRFFFSQMPSHMSPFTHTQPSPQGSIFKLTVAYAALRQQLETIGMNTSKLHPSLFTMTDTTFHLGEKVFVGYNSQGKPIPQMYKGGRIPKSVDKNIGDLDLVHAIERSSNPYFSLLAGDFLTDPKKMLSAASLLGYGQKTGIELPSESKGKIPSDLETNKTGVYTTAIGQHTLLATPLQAAIVLSSLATGEVVIPRIVKMAIGPEVSSQKNLTTTQKTPYEELMKTINIKRPLWVVDDAKVSKTLFFVTAKNKKKSIPITTKEREILFEGMNAVCRRMSADKRLQTYFHSRPDIFKAFETENAFMIGKSSTAELYERLGLAIGQKPTMHNHVWFGGIFFKEPSQKERKISLFKNPELIVIVFLRYGAHGKDAAPLAASVAKEWKNIQKRHGIIPSS